MSLLKGKAALLLGSILALAGGAVPTAKAYKLEDGTEIDIAQSGDTYSQEDLVTVDGKPAPDATYTLNDKTEIVVKEGKISDIKKEESSEVEAAADEVTTTEEVTEVSASADDPAALKAENESLKAQLATFQGTLSQVQAKMTAFEKIMGEQESADVVIPKTSSKTPKPVTAKGTMTAEEAERKEMLDKRKKRGEDL